MNDPLIPSLILLPLAPLIVFLSDPHKAENCGRSAGSGSPRSFWWPAAGLVAMLLLACLIAAGGVRIEPWVAVGLVAVPVVFLVGKIALMRFRLREEHRALRMAQAGDLEGAIWETRKRIEADDSAPQAWETLSLLYCMQQRWEEALEALQTAERLGASGGLFLSNKANVLSQLERYEEALPLIEEAVATNPQEFTFRHNYCLILHYLDRTEEAAEQLKTLEEIVRTHTVFPRSVQKERERLIEECRGRVGGG